MQNGGGGHSQHNQRQFPFPNHRDERHDGHGGGIGGGGKDVLTGGNLIPVASNPMLLSGGGHRNQFSNSEGDGGEDISLTERLRRLAEG